MKLAGGLSRLVGKGGSRIHNLYEETATCSDRIPSSLSPEGLFQLQKDVNRIHERDGDGVHGDAGCGIMRQGRLKESRS